MEVAPNEATVEIPTPEQRDDASPVESLPVGVLLTERQRAYCVERYKGANYSEAYRLAFPGERTKRENDNRGRKLARLPRIREFIAALNEKRLDFMDIQPAQISREVARIAFSDLRKLFDPETDEILPMNQWPDDMAAAVASYEEEIGPGGTRLKRKIRLWNKPDALKLLADFKAMTGGKPDATQRATFTFNFGTGKGAQPGRMGGKRVEKVINPKLSPPEAAP